jgi:hypothetical protein
MLRAAIATLEAALLVLGFVSPPARGAGLADRVSVFAGTEPRAGAFRRGA